MTVAGSDDVPLSEGEVSRLAWMDTVTLGKVYGTETALDARKCVCDTRSGPVNEIDESGMFGTCWAWELRVVVIVFMISSSLRSTHSLICCTCSPDAGCIARCSPMKL